MFTSIFEPVTICDRIPVLFKVAICDLEHLFLPLHLCRDFQAQRVEPDEAGGIVLVVGFGRIGFHHGDVRVIQTTVGNPSRPGARAQFQHRFPSADKR